MDASTNPFSHSSAHRDVLDAAIPADTISRTVLMNELKNRGKGAVLSQQWMDADLLYQKAIEVAKASSDAKEEAILRSNLALCQGKMNGWQSSHEAATLATQLDPDYVKGWWRLGQAAAALEQYDDSIKAFKRALECEPSNKAIPKELAKIQQKQREAKAKKPKTTATTSASAPSTASGSTASASKPAAVAASSKPKASSGGGSSSASNISSGVEKMQVDDHGFSKSDIVRGYKIVNGKKTSYFHNELDDKTKELIGDIAPKRLEGGERPAAAGTDSSPTAGAGGRVASAWNKAGTWEERDVSKWACDSLADQLKSAKHAYDGDDGNNRAVSVDKASVDGSASVAMVRGKKKYIYELCLTVNWRIVDSDTDDVLATGSLKFPDVDGTCAVGDEYEATDFKLDAASRLSRSDVYPQVFAKGLRNALHQAIDNWVGLLKEAY